MPLDEGFVNSLSEDIRKEPAFAEIAKGDNNSLVKNLIDSQKSLGRAILLPDEKDPEDKRAEKISSIYDKLGRPKAHTEYDLKEIIKEDSGIDPARLGKFTETFHKAGLSNAQAQTLVRAYMEDLASSALTKESAVQTLSQEWGDKIESNIGVAKAALVKFDEKGELLAFLEDTGLGNHPAILKFLHAVGSQFKEGEMPRLGDRAGALDKPGAQQQLTTILNDKKHPYWNRSMAGHKEAIAEVANLNKVIHGEEVVAELGTH